jgi:glycosyltransferase involved in cell wall biosynthesis
MAAPTSCTLIISIYNQAAQLRRVLESVARQSNCNFDIVIADDGSADAVEPVLNAFRTQHPAFSLTHVWHEDRGFHKTIILNKAYRAARGEYLIVIDGDMLLHDRFIENHLRHARPDRVLCGYRGVKLGEQITAELLSGERHFSQNMFTLSWQALRGQLEEVSRGLVINNRTLRRLVARRSKRLSGCNFSIHRENLFRVNGMDETILVYGFEDFELGHRLGLAGIRLTDVSRCCNTYHLDHGKRAADDTGTLRTIKQNILGSRALQCRYGLETLDHGSTVEDFLTGEQPA